MSTQVLAPADVNNSAIKGIFDEAFLETIVTDDGSLRVTEGGIKVLISVDESKQLVQYLMLFGYRRGTKTGDQLELVNELNKNIVFLRAWSFGNGVAFDYSLPYDGGLIPQQVISAYRWLRKTVLAGVQQYDRKNIVA